MTVTVPPAAARDQVDPRCFAPIGVHPRTFALVTPVEQDGALVVERTAGRRGTPYWSLLFAVVGGPAAGLHAELRLWHASANRAYVAGRIGSLLGLDEQATSELEPDAALLAPRVERALATSSYRASVGTASDGRLEVAFVDAVIDRREPGADLPAPRRVVDVSPPAEPMAPDPALDRLTFIHARDAATVRSAAQRLAGATTLGLDIETDCGPLGSPAAWRPSDGAIRLVQVAGRVGGELVCVVADCYATRPDALVALIGDPARRIVAHNIRYEQEWLAFHAGVGAFAQPFDTSCAFRILDRHWQLRDPAYEAPDTRLETVMRRVTGHAKSPFGAAFWGADPLPPDQLRYAALDAACLLAIADAADRIGARMGCTSQIVAASKMACDEGVRRVPPSRPPVLAGAERLIAEATTPAQLLDAGRIVASLAIAARDRRLLRAGFAARRQELSA